MKDYKSLLPKWFIGVCLFCLGVASTMLPGTGRSENKNTLSRIRLISIADDFESTVSDTVAIDQPSVPSTTKPSSLGAFKVPSKKENSIETTIAEDVAAIEKALVEAKKKIAQTVPPVQASSSTSATYQAAGGGSTGGGSSGGAYKAKTYSAPVYQTYSGGSTGSYQTTYQTDCNVYSYPAMQQSYQVSPQSYRSTPMQPVRNVMRAASPYQCYVDANGNTVCPKSR